MSDSLSSQPLLRAAEVVMEAARLQALQAEISRSRADARYPLLKIVGLGLRVTGSEAFEKTHDAWALDISYRAVGVLSTQMLSMGSHYWVDLTPVDPTRPEWVLPTRVMRCEKMIKGMYHVALEFGEG